MGVFDGQRRAAPVQRVRQVLNGMFVLENMGKEIAGLYVAHHLTFDAYFGADRMFKVGHKATSGAACMTTHTGPASFSPSSTC